jgi:hypothetical protein
LFVPLIVSKLFEAKKRGYLEQPLASREWFIKKLKEEHPLKLDPKKPFYTVEKERAIAYLDYKWLGHKIEGAPDGTDEEVFKYLFQEIKPYPTRIYYQPHWFDTNLKELTTQDYFIWTFLETCAYEHQPVSVEAARWRDHVGVQEAWLEQHTVLEKFKRPEIIPECSATVEKEIKRLSLVKYHQVIHDVELDYPVELYLVNKRLLDYRPIPSHIDGKQFSKPYIKWYLEKRIKEWLAAGGHIEWKKNFQYFIKYSEHPATGSRLFLKVFYWDLWRDLANLRLEFQRVTGAALVIAKWWQYARFPFRLVTEPPVLRKYYYQTVEV